MRSIEEWKSIIDNQKKSNLSILDYCKNNNISKTSFYRAKSKIEDSKVQIIKLKSNSVNTSTISLYLNDNKVVLNYHCLEELEDILKVIKNV